MTSSRGGRNNPRLEADRAIAETVRREGQSSREYRDLETNLKDLVIGTLTNLSKEETLFREVRRQCSFTLPEPPSEWPYNRRRVFYLAAELAVARFMRTHIMGRRWVPEKGATIRTCCVRAGLYAFADEYRTYCKEEVTRYEPLNDGLDSPLSIQPSRDPDPAITAEQRDRISRALAHTSPQVVTIVYLDAEGWTQKEIGKEIGIDAKQVGHALRKFRSAVRK